MMLVSLPEAQRPVGLWHLQQQPKTKWLSLAKEWPALCRHLKKRAAKGQSTGKI